MKQLLTHAEGDPGETGKFNPAKAIGIFLALVTGYVSLAFFGVLVPELPQPLTFTQWWQGTLIMMILSAGSYAGLGKGVFKGMVEKYVTKATK